MLTSFQIDGFRTFSHLRVERLGRVNLIVGRNNVGKTMFLEALRLHALGGSPGALSNLLMERDEVVTEITSAETDEAEYQLRFVSLFHHGLSENGSPAEIGLGPIGDKNRLLTISPKLFRQVRTRPDMLYRLEDIDLDNKSDTDDDSAVLQGLLVTQGETTRRMPFNSLNRNRPRGSRFRTDLGIWPSFVTARGVTDRELSRWWDAVALQEAEGRVIESLAIISPVERINLVEHPARRGERLVMAKLSGEAAPVSLKSLGDGMFRIFQIALALECARVKEASQQPSLFADLVEENGHQAMLLVDEIENGIHYTALPDLWRFVLRVAKMHNVQVFATSHSWDCIQALQEAASESPDDDVMLIRLEQKQRATKAVLFDRKELAVVTRDNIEVR